MWLIFTVFPGCLRDVSCVYKKQQRIHKDSYRKFWGNYPDESGALLVGRIHNYHEEGEVFRGQEKGYFEFGGFTIILLIKKRIVMSKSEVRDNSAKNLETEVCQGEVIAVRV